MIQRASLTHTTNIQYNRNSSIVVPTNVIMVDNELWSIINTFINKTIGY